MKNNRWRRAGLKAALALLILFVLLILLAPAVSAQLLGDVNFDGHINIYDVVLVQGHALGYYPPLSAAQLIAADVNGDGLVNVVDANLILQYVQGFITSFPAQQLHAPLLFLPGESTTQAGSAVSFQWGTVAGATHYQLEISRVSNGTIFRTVDLYNYTSTAQYGFLNDGTQYRWRVRAGNSLNWSSWSAYRTFTNGSSTLSAPNLTAPAYNSSISGTSVFFSWHPVTGANKYQLQVYKGSEALPTKDLVLGNVTASEQFNFVSDGSQYRWRVRAGNNADWGNWSSYFIFNSGSLPSAPALLSPSVGTIAGNSISFQWYPSSGADKYELLVTRDNDGSEFRRQLVGNHTANTQIGFPNDGSVFRWKVRAGNNAGWSPWSVERLFTNSGVVDTPVLLSPAADANAFGSAITFNWRSAPGATRYTVEIVEVLAGGTILFKRQELGNVTSATFYDFPNDGSQFKWRVRSGNVSTWSDNWSSYRTFSNGLLPGPVTLTSPVNNATEPGSSVNFSWSASPVAGTDKYNLQVMRVRDGLIVKDAILDNVTASTQTGFPGDGTRYQWRVRAGTKDGWGNWSGFNTFTSGGLNQPILLLPLNNGSVESAWVTFEWKPVAGATRYRLIIEDEDQNLIADETLGYVHAFRQRNFPNDGTVYTWSVQAGNREGWGPISNERIFTNGTPYAAPLQRTPGANADVQLSAAAAVYSVSFGWNAVSGANQYQLQVVAAKNNMLLIDVPLGNVLEYKNGNGFGNGEQYKWRVRAGKDSTWGTWSGYRNFIGYTTLPTLPAPLLLSPAENATASGTTVTFKWTPVLNITNYDLEVINVSNGEVFKLLNNITPGATVNEVTHPVGGFPDNSTKFMWRVRGVDGRWSLYRTFTNGLWWWNW